MAAKKEVVDQEVVAPVAKVLSKKELIAQSMTKINKQFGAKTVGTLSSKIEEFKIEYIKTRSLAYNKMLHGGFVKGRISEIYGNQDSGKTSISLDTIGYNMQMDPNFYAGWFETEGHFDINYAISFGIDPERFTVWSMEDYGAEGGLDILEAQIRTGAYNMITVNTVAGLTPKKELEGEMIAQDVALQARMMSKLMRKIVAIASKKGTHVQFINQVRVNVGSYGGGSIPNGGKALAFWASQRLNHNGGFIEAEEKAKGYDPELFKKIDVSVKKNRCSSMGNPYQKCTYYAEYGVGIDQIGTLPDQAVEFGIIKKNGNWCVDAASVDTKGKAVPKILPDGTKLAWPGAGGFRAYLREHPEYVEELRNRIEALIGGPIDIAPVECMSVEEVDQAKIEQAELEAGLEGTDKD